jgi:hypothetical protein
MEMEGGRLMFELRYYGAIIEVIRQGAYEICTPVDIDRLYKMAGKIKKAGKCYAGWCKCLLKRSRALEKMLLGSFRNYRYIEQLIVLAALIEILEELYEWFSKKELA